MAADFQITFPKRILKKYLQGQHIKVHPVIGPKNYVFSCLSNKTLVLTKQFFNEKLSIF